MAHDQVSTVASSTLDMWVSRHDLGMRRQQALEGLDIEPPVICDRRELQDHAQPLAQEMPGDDIGVVLHLGEQDLVTGLEVGAQTRGHQVDGLGPALGEDDLGRLGPDEPRYRLAGALVGLGGLVGERVASDPGAHLA